MSGTGNGRGLVTAMIDAMQADALVPRDVFVGRVMALRPQASAESLRSNLFKRKRLEQAGLSVVSFGDSQYVALGDSKTLIEAFEKATSGLALLFSKQKAQRELEEARKALANANAAQKYAAAIVKAAETRATGLGL